MVLRGSLAKVAAVKNNASSIPSRTTARKAELNRALTPPVEVRLIDARLQFSFYRAGLAIHPEDHPG